MVAQEVLRKSGYSVQQEEEQLRYASIPTVTMCILSHYYSTIVYIIVAGYFSLM